MLEKLKPCPVCGHVPEHPRDFFNCDGENVFYVGCDNEECPADIGIIHDDLEEAAHIWNAIPRPMRWTKEPPTEPVDFSNVLCWKTIYPPAPLKA